MLSMISDANSDKSAVVRYTWEERAGKGHAYILFLSTKEVWPSGDETYTGILTIEGQYLKISNVLY